MWLNFCQNDVFGRGATESSIPHHLDDDLVEGCHAAHDLSTASIILQEEQSCAKAYREEDDPQ